MTTFIQAPNNDGFLARLTPIEQALEKGKVITSSLEVRSLISFPLFLCRRALRPLFAFLLEIDTLASYRAHAVATSLLAYCKSNTAFMDDANKERVVKLITTLQNKAKPQNQALITPVLDSVKTLEKTEYVAPVAAAAARVNACVPLLKAMASNESFDAHAQLAQKEQSFAFSPSGLIDLFGVMALGAGDDTFAKAVSLGTSASNEDTADAVKTLKVKSARQMVGYSTEAALKLDPVLTAQLKTCGLEECVREGVSVFGYKSARTVTNDRIKAQTGANFKEFLKKDNNEFLVQAIALKAILPRGNVSAATINKPFTFSDGKSVEATLLLTQTTAKVHEGSGFTLIEVGYKNGLSKVVVVPEKGVDFSTLFDSLSPKALAGYRTQAKEQKVKLYMPEVKQEHVVDMSSALKDKKIVPETIFGKKLEGITTGVYFEEGYEIYQEAEADKAEEYFVDHSFYWFVMQDDQVVIQGQVDSPDGLKP